MSDTHVLALSRPALLVLLPTGSCSDAVLATCGAAARVEQRPQNADWRAELLQLRAEFPGQLLLRVRHAHVWLADDAIERLIKAALLAAGPVAPMSNTDVALTAALADGDLGAFDAASIDAASHALGLRALFDVAASDPPLWVLGANANPHAPLAVLDHVYVHAPDLAMRGLITPADRRERAPAHPLAALRRALALSGPQPAAQWSTAARDARPVVLHILHGWGGGAERFVRDLANVDTAHHHLLLRAMGNPSRKQHGEFLELAMANGGPALRRWLMTPAIGAICDSHPVYAQALQQLIADFAVEQIWVSSLIGHALDALRCALPLRWMVHDYFPLWPNLHRDFGAPDARFDAEELSADLLLGKGGPFAEHDPAWWTTMRASCITLLLSAQAQLVAPSQSALRNLNKIAPALAALPQRCIAHGTAGWPSAAYTRAAIGRKDKLRILVLGRINGAKGLDLLRQLTPQLSPYCDLYLIGAGKAAEALFGVAGVHIQLDYAYADLPSILGRLQPHAALLPVTVSETFSYTLSELWRLAIAPIATRMGAFAERIEHGLSGLLVDANAAAIVAQIAALQSDRRPLQRIQKELQRRTPRSLTPMRNEYMPLLPSGDRPPLRYAVTQAGPSDLARALLADTLSDTEMRLASATKRLREQELELAKRADWGLELQEQLNERTAWASNLRQQLQDLESQLESAHLQELTDELERRASWALDLDQRLAERTSWALNLQTQIGAYEKQLAQAAQRLGEQDQELARRALWATELDQQLRERTAWARQLNQQIEDQEKQLSAALAQLSERDAELSRRTTWAFELDALLAERTQWALDLQQQMQDHESHLLEQDAQLADRTRWAHDLQQQVRDNEAQLQSAAAQRVEQETELAARAQWAQRLDRELTESTRWAQQLDQDLRQSVAESQEQRIHFENSVSALRADLEKSMEEAKHMQQQLMSRIDELHAENVRLNLTGADLQVQVSTLERERQTMRAEIERLSAQRAEILSSSSWRLTAPLRTVANFVKRLRASLRFRTARFFGLLRRVRGSVARRGFGGTVARIRQEFRSSPQSIAAPVLTQAPVPAAEYQGFVLPSSDTPVVSIIVPVYNQLHHTWNCLKALAETAGSVSFEVIVVDDGSSDDTASAVPRIDGVRFHKNPQNLGFIGACNVGAALARGKYLFFLNNDTAVQNGWLEPLLRTYQEFDRVGLVGSKLIYPDGRLQEAGGIVFKDGSGWNFGRFDHPDDPRYDYPREADYCSGAAILIEKGLFERFGGFDSLYKPAYYEDTDMAFKVRAAGLRVMYQPASRVVHFEGISSGTDLTSGIKRYQVVNQTKFLDRWQSELLLQPEPTDHGGIWRAATHRARGRILLIDATTPTPDQDSGSVRYINLIRVLRSLGWQCTFFADNRAYFGRYSDDLRALGVEVQFHPWLSDPISFFRERGSQFDAVMLSRHYVAAPYVELVREHAPQALLLFDTVDLHYLREQRAAALSGSEALARQAHATRIAELDLIERCDVTLVVSPVEQQLLASEAPGQRVEVLSNIHEVAGRRADFAARKDIWFVGGFQHTPNVDAVQWFAAAIWPRIHQALPDLRFHIVGSKITADVEALAGNGIEVHGFVENIERFLDGCRISVAPLRYGAGVKGKVNQSMAFGQPVVATPIAVEGMEIEAGSEALVAEHADEFADAVIRLYQDPTLWLRLSDNGLANIEAHFSFAAARVALDRILARG